jgi:1-deoxy-D-xylulose-5-phosphate synthase
MRYDVYRGLRKMKLINNDRRGNILRFNNSLKALLTQQHNLFEGFSIRYFGPIDGHDVGYIFQVCAFFHQLDQFGFVGYGRSETITYQN